MTKTNVACPICGGANNCCNGLDKNLGICWCTAKQFPSDIFDKVPEEHLRKLCICEQCVDKFTNR